MSAVLAIIAGLGLVAGFFAYYSHVFYLRANESNDDNGGTKLMSLLCFFGSVLMVDTIMYALILIAQNESLIYLSDTILVVAMQVVMWTTIVGIGMYCIFLVLGSLVYGYQLIAQAITGRKKGDDT